MSQKLNTTFVSFFRHKMAEENAILPYGRVYKLSVPGCDDYCYIGSTVSDVATRLSQHKSDAVRHATTDWECSCASRFLFELGEVQIELLEEVQGSKNDLLDAERRWIEKTPTAINTNKPNQTWEERWVANRKHNIALHKKWMAEHPNWRRKPDEPKKGINFNQNSSHKGKHHKLTDEQVAEIRQLRLTGMTINALTTQFGLVKKTIVSEICKDLEPELERQKKELDDRIITMYRSGKYSMRKLHEEVGRSPAYISGILPRE